MTRRQTTAFIVLGAAIVVLSACCLTLGSVDIPAGDVWQALIGGDTRESWRLIVTATRVPMALTALLAGSSLAVAGLLMQTTFDNPLAGPSILGVSNGASLGVAIVVLALGGTAAPGVGGSVATMAGALAGAGGVIALLVALSRVVKSTPMLLIAGIMIGYLASSAIALLNFAASREGVHSYVVWGLGNFTSVTPSRLLLYIAPQLVMLGTSLLLVKPLNALLLGQRYAASMGVSVRSVRTWLLVISGVLTALVTAFCGPIGFIGLIVPHIARMCVRTSNHMILLPATMLTGAALGLFCAVAGVSTGHGVIPINAITPVIGVPIIIYIIINRRKLLYFN